LSHLGWACGVATFAIQLPTPSHSAVIFNLAISHPKFGRFEEEDKDGMSWLVDDSPGNLQAGSPESETAWKAVLLKSPGWKPGVRNSLEGCSPVLFPRRRFF
jgi:hypothetical protein